MCLGVSLSIDYILLHTTAIVASLHNNLKLLELYTFNECNKYHDRARTSIDVENKCSCVREKNQSKYTSPWPLGANRLASASNILYFYSSRLWWAAVHGIPPHPDVKLPLAPMGGQPAPPGCTDVGRARRAEGVRGVGSGAASTRIANEFELEDCAPEPPSLP